MSKIPGTLQPPETDREITVDVSNAHSLADLVTLSKEPIVASEWVDTHGLFVHMHQMLAAIDAANGKRKNDGTFGQYITIRGHLALNLLIGLNALSLPTETLQEINKRREKLNLLHAPGFYTIFTHYFENIFPEIWNTAQIQFLNQLLNVSTDIDCVHKGDFPLEILQEVPTEEGARWAARPAQNGKTIVRYTPLLPVPDNSISLGPYLEISQGELQTQSLNSIQMAITQVTSQGMKLKFTNIPHVQNGHLIQEVNYSETDQGSSISVRLNTARKAAKDLGYGVIQAAVLNGDPGQGIELKALFEDVLRLENSSDAQDHAKLMTKIVIEMLKSYYISPNDCIAGAKRLGLINQELPTESILEGVAEETQFLSYLYVYLGDDLYRRVLGFISTTYYTVIAELLRLPVEPSAFDLFANSFKITEDFNFGRRVPLDKRLAESTATSSRDRETRQTLAMAAG